VWIVEDFCVFFFSLSAPFHNSAFPIIEDRIIALPNNTNGVLLHLNYPKSLPNNVEYTQHLIAPLGDVIIVELSGVSFTENGCQFGGSITVSLITSQL
jgi:hypothetical protein